MPKPEYVYHDQETLRVLKDIAESLRVLAGRNQNTSVGSVTVSVDSESLDDPIGSGLHSHARRRFYGT